MVETEQINKRIFALSLYYKLDDNISTVSIERLDVSK